MSIAGLVARGVLVIIAAVIALGMLLGGVAACKEFQRYQYRQDAKNNLVRAESEKKIKTEEAIATKLSATHLAEAEVTRAKGVAAANEIIAGSITPEYLRYYYISQLSEVEHLGGKIIYVPTEAGLPILEAGRLNQP